MDMGLVGAKKGKAGIFADEHRSIMTSRGKFVGGRRRQWHFIIIITITYQNTSRIPKSAGPWCGWRKFCLHRNSY
ncbi:MAG: hypothetical protein WA228_01475 [Desulfobaccales bacterium]